MFEATLAQLYGFEGTAAAKIFMVGFAGLAVVAAVFIRLSLLQWLLAAVLFITALAAPVNLEKTAFIRTWLLPLQLQRPNVHLALGILLTIVMILSGKIVAARIPVQGLFTLAIALFAAMLQFIHDGPREGLESVGFALATIPCLMIATTAVNRSYEGCLKTLRMIMVVSVVWTVGSSIQFVINPAYLVNNQGRFWGLLANAQHAAMLVAPFFTIALWLLLNDPMRRFKLLWIGLIAINLLFMAWTGSRTGLLMTLIGAGLVLYNRVGRMIILLPIAAVVTYLLSFLADELQIGSNIDRLTSGENTRAGVWTAQIRNAFENPLIGVGWHSAGGSESSYLAGFASYGFGMLLLMMAFLVWSMWRCASLWLRRRHLPREQRPLIDLFIAWNAMYFAAAVFEGIMLGRSSPSQSLMLIVAGIGVWLSEQTVLASAEQVDDSVLDSGAAADYSFEVQPEYS